MKHKAQLSITRPQGFGPKKVKITVRDTDAVVEFLEVEIDLDKFTECLTGLSGVDCDMEFRRLEVVGKVREHKELTFKMPDSAGFYDKDGARAEAPKPTPDGWEFSDYFGSQDSFFSKETQEGDRGEWARTSIMRWVEKGE